MTAQPTSSRLSRLRRWGPAVLVVAVAIGIFANSFHNEFVYDDWFAIVQNPPIRYWSSLGELLDPTSDFHQTFLLLSYRPLQNLSYLVSYKLFGLNAGGHHLFNVLLHAANALLVFVVLRRLTSDEPVALVGALAFAVHPVHLEAVQVSALRADLLATPFFLAALLCHERLRDRPTAAPLVWAGLAAASYFLACMGKEIAATVPLVALVLDLRRGGPKALRSREGLRPYLGYAVAAALYGWLRFGLFTNIHQGEAYLGGSPWTAVLTTGRIFVAYLGHLLVPVTLRADYVLEPSTGPDATSVGAWALLAALAGVAWLARRRHPTVTLGLAWLGVTLLPVANLVPIRNPMADRYLYLPSIGFCAVVGWAVSEGRRAAQVRWGVAGGRAMAALAAAILLTWGAITWKGNTIWGDEVTLWSQNLRLEPNSSRAHLNLGHALERKGRIAEAEKQLGATIRRWPRWAEPYHSLGMLYANQGENQKAIPLFRQTLQLSPSHRRARSHLATLLAISAASPEAIEQARQAILADPWSATAHYNLAILYARQGQTEQAKATFREAIRLNPNFPSAYNNLGVLWLEEANYAEAEASFLRAIAADPTYAKAHLNLANLYINVLKTPEKALPHLEAVIRIKPDHPDIGLIRSQARKLRQGI